VPPMRSASSRAGTITLARGRGGAESGSGGRRGTRARAQSPATPAQAQPAAATYRAISSASMAERGYQESS
jgi:hypothetical protein